MELGLAAASFPEVLELESELDSVVEELGPELFGHFEEAKVLGHFLAPKETKVQES